MLFCALSAAAAFGLDAAEKVRVACVGDSITAGSGIKNPQTDSYPAVLADMLGDAYEVENFGASGRTLLRRGDNPYWNDGKFERAKAFRPDIVILKLGTNDSKLQNWEHGAGFKKDLLDMIAEFQSLDPRPEILLCTPMFVAKKAYGIRNEVVRDDIIPVIKAVAADRKLKLVDFYSAFAGDSAMLPDGVHPNEAGAMKMAGIAFKAITGMEAPVLQEPRGARSVVDGFARLDFPFHGRAITCVFPREGNPEKTWVWVVDSFERLFDRDKARLAEGKTMVWADASIWWGSPSSMRWAFEFHTYLTEKLGLSKKAELEASGLGALFALCWAHDSTDKVSRVYLTSPVCDLSKFPDRGNPRQVEEFLKKWRITREELDDPRINIINNLSKAVEAGIVIEFGPESDGADTGALKAALEKAKAGVN